MSIRVLCLLFSLMGSIASASATMEFAGYMKISGEQCFLVADLDTRRTSDWLKVGDTFYGHKVAGFDEKTEVLVLEHAGSLSRLSMKGSRVLDVPRFAIKVDEQTSEVISLGFGDDRSKFLDYLRRRKITLREYRSEVEAAVLRAQASMREGNQTPNKAPEPTPGSVTPRATEGVSK